MVGIATTTIGGAGTVVAASPVTIIGAGITEETNSS